MFKFWAKASLILIIPSVSLAETSCYTLWIKTRILIVAPDLCAEMQALYFESFVISLSYATYIYP